MRVHTTRHPRHESLDAPAVARPLLYSSAGNEPSVRGKPAQEAYRSHPPSPHSSTPGRSRTYRPQHSILGSILKSTRAPTQIRSTNHGPPGAGTCLRLQQTRPADTHSQPRQHSGAVAPMRGHMQAARGHSAGNALRGLRREVGGEGVIHRPAGCTIPTDTERETASSSGCERCCLEGGGMV